MIFTIAIAIGCFGAAGITAHAMVIPPGQPCTPTIIGGFWLDGEHCIDAVQASCLTTHKCFDANGNLVYECIYELNCPH